MEEKGRETKTYSEKTKSDKNDGKSNDGEDEFDCRGAGDEDEELKGETDLRREGMKKERGDSQLLYSTIGERRKGDGRRRSRRI